MHQLNRGRMAVPSQFLADQYRNIRIWMFPSVSALITNIGHPLWVWPITPVHAHYKLFPSNRSRTNEWTKNLKKKSPIEEEKKMICSVIVSTVEISNIRHVSCCFVFWLKKKCRKNLQNALTNRFAAIWKGMQMICVCAYCASRTEPKSHTHSNPHMRVKLDGVNFELCTCL